MGCVPAQRCKEVPAINTQPISSSATSIEETLRKTTLQKSIIADTCLNQYDMDFNSFEVKI